MSSNTAQHTNSARLSYLAPLEVRKARELVDGLLASSTPCRTLRALAIKGASGQLESFEEYASLVLRDAGALSLGSIPEHAVFLEPPGNGQLSHFVCKRKLSRDSLKLLRNVEDALNRLICVRDALEDAQANALAVSNPHIFISWTGVSHIPAQTNSVGIVGRMPYISPIEKPTSSYFNEIDWLVLDDVAGKGHAVFLNSLKPNMRQSVLGAHAPASSDWDVRTRLATVLGKLELPLAFDYRYDCDVSHQAVEVVFVAPDASSLPQRIASTDRKTLKQLDTQSEAARLAYTLRLAALVACGCFGSGHRLQHAHITAEDSDGDALFTCSFERQEFVRDALVAIDSGKLANPSLRFDANGIVALLKPAFIAFGEEAPANSSDRIANRIEPWLDNRKLAPSMTTLFGAKLVSDLDTRHYEGGMSNSVEEAKADAADSAIAAIARLEDLVESLEPSPPDDNASSRPLYCANPFSRIAVPLLADEFSVAERADAFLRDQLYEDAESSAGLEKFGVPSFFRAPNALFHAHMGLSDLYQRLGDYSGAIAHADTCIALAPTTASAYFRKADILAEQRLDAQAINVLMAGLRCAISKRDCALLYYHMALLLWRIGRKRESAAVQVYTASLQGEFAEKARKVVKSLRTHADSPVIVHGSPLAAAREMSRSRIPVVPGEEARALIARAAIGLSCANAPEAAAPYAAALASYLPGDRIIATACRSIQYGLKEPSRLPGDDQTSLEY